MKYVAKTGNKQGKADSKPEGNNSESKDQQQAVKTTELATTKTEPAPAVTQKPTELPDAKSESAVTPKAQL